MITIVITLGQFLQKKCETILILLIGSPVKFINCSARTLAYQLNWLSLERSLSDFDVEATTMWIKVNLQNLMTSQRVTFSLKGASKRKEA